MQNLPLLLNLQHVKLTMQKAPCGMRTTYSRHKTLNTDTACTLAGMELLTA